MRIGVDTGGTFTDVVAVGADGRLLVAKVPSTPEDPGRAVLEGIARVAGAIAGHEVVHGTTVATNALLTRTGGPTGLVTTRGFEDVLALGRQARPKLYALEPEVEAPLVPEELRLGVAERLAADGGVIAALDAGEVERVAGLLKANKVRSVAVVLLHSYLDARHERMLGEGLAKLGVPVSLSSEVLPEHREYERTATTVADAYVAPVVGEYLARLEGKLGGNLRVMQSSGGAAAAREARRHPVRTLLSGPAAGVVGARAAAARAGVRRAITFDMGGTSTDVAVIDLDREVELESEGEVAGIPIRVPSLRIHTVGAGGGSIARVDEGGALKVGPRSAGAEPGPACYGRGGSEPTVTDAALVEGRLDPERFLGGTMRLDRAAAERAMGDLAAKMGIGMAEAARGVARVATAVMARAIKVITVERGRDPRDFTLVAFGGAGGMHACEVAEALGMERILVPAAPGLLCAYGALAADVARDRVATRIVRGAGAISVAAIDRELDVLEEAARAELASEGFARSEQRVARRVDLRYRGQSYEIPIDLPAPDLAEAFHLAHEARYGFAARDREIERVAVRVHARGLVAPPPPLTVDRPRVPMAGPSLIVEYSATTFVAPGWVATADSDGALHLSKKGGTRSTPSST